MSVARAERSGAVTVARSTVGGAEGGSGGGAGPTPPVKLTTAEAQDLIHRQVTRTSELGHRLHKDPTRVFGIEAATAQLLNATALVNDGLTADQVRGAFQRARDLVRDLPTVPQDGGGAGGAGGGSTGGAAG